jgi:CII-binding regulator of phage lambda lysogenization HflD
MIASIQILSKEKNPFTRGLFCWVDLRIGMPGNANSDALTALESVTRRNPGCGWTVVGSRESRQKLGLTGFRSILVLDHNSHG